MKPKKKLSGGNIVYDKCIFCKHKMSLVVNVYKEIYNCFWCGKGGETSGKEFKQIYESWKGKDDQFSYDVFRGSN